jgi:hypothetical protein
MWVHLGAECTVFQFIQLYFIIAPDPGLPPDTPDTVYIDQEYNSCNNQYDKRYKPPGFPERFTDINIDTLPLFIPYTAGIPHFQP